VTVTTPKSEPTVTSPIIESSSIPSPSVTNTTTVTPPPPVNTTALDATKTESVPLASKTSGGSCGQCIVS
jgi:hypothetical protein